MIILLNLTTFFFFFIKGLLHKNEFSFIRSILKKLTKKLNIIISSTYKYISFKKFLKLYGGFKTNMIGLNKKTSFKDKICIWLLINKFGANFFLLKLFFKKKKNHKTNFKFSNPSKSGLNSFLKNNPFKKQSGFAKLFTSIYKINYKPSSFVKYSSDNNISVYFLRKNKIFNKGRYSRNRQLYRTGVYWCIWLSVFLGYCLYFNFYRFTFNFGYQWWLIFSFLFLFVNQKMLKYNFYNIKVVLSEIKKNSNWVALFVYNIYRIFLKK